MVLSAGDVSVSGADRYPIDVAVWGAIGDAVGGGLVAPPDSLAGPSASSLPGGADPIGVLDRVISGPIAVQPGMGAEVYVRAHDRTALEFLVEPLVNAARRSMREH